MFRYLKALFGVYDHKWQSQSDYFKSINSFLRDHAFDIEVINDLHIGSEYQDNPNAQDLVDAVFNGTTSQWFFALGDIYDFVCAPSKNLYDMSEKFYKLRERLKNRYRMGNHEAEGVEAVELVERLPNGTVVWLDHGDLITADQRKRYLPYRKRQHGASRKDLAKVEFLDHLDFFKAKRPLPKDFIETVTLRMIKDNFDVYICGHFHVEAQRYYTYKGKLIIILPAHQLNKVKIPKVR